MTAGAARLKTSFAVGPAKALHNKLVLTVGWMDEWVDAWLMGDE